MFYAMLYGHLPFWGENEDEFIEKIITQPLRFDTDVPVTQECKDCIRGMLQKDPEKRYQLLEVMNLPYFMMDDEDIEAGLKKAETQIEEQKHREEEKAEKQWESEILSGLHLDQHGSSSSAGGKQKTPGSKSTVKDKTPIGKQPPSGSTFGSHVKDKKKSTPMSGGSKPNHDIKKR